MEIGVCCHPPHFAEQKENAFDYFEVNVQTFLVPEKENIEFQSNLEIARAAVKPVKVANCFLPGDLVCVGPDIDEARLVRYAETAFQRAAQVGIDIIVLGSGKARTVGEGYPKEQAMEDFVRILRQLGPIAQRHGVTLVIEPLNKAECNFINSLAEGAAAVEGCGHPNVRLLADYYHMRKDGESASEVLRFGHLLAHAHVAEVEGRAFPGKSGDDFRPFFTALQQAGYKGRVAIEPHWDNAQLDAQSSTRYIREQIESVG